eukprot:147224-Rhodomonas_salina.2
MHHERGRGNASRETTCQCTARNHASVPHERQGCRASPNRLVPSHCILSMHSGKALFCSTEWKAEHARQEQEQEQEQGQEQGERESKSKSKSNATPQRARAGGRGQTISGWPMAGPSGM